MWEEKLLVTLWRQAGFSRDLETGLRELLETLREYLPLETVKVYRHGNESGELILDACGGAGAGVEFPRRRCSLLPSQLLQLKAWEKQHFNKPVRVEDALPQLTGILTDSGGFGSVEYVVPFSFEEYGSGLLFWKFGLPSLPAATETLLSRLTEPLLLLFVNQQRQDMLHALRDQVAVDRHTLLQRLGKPTLSQTIIGAERGLKAVMERVEQVAASDVAALILGETGAGKEVIARAIHEHSLRREGPFVRVNCGALPPELIDSELFGHEKGSFTGAVNARRGWFERASGGTLFLDEIGELPLAAQVRLLRVLQDGILQRVGSESDIHVDVRVVAATHRNLPNMVQRGEFREDLWYRLAVFPILLPSLRDRKDDIPALSTHFIHRAAVRMGVPTPALTDGDILLLQEYSWPGNVRELGAVLERAVILGRGRFLDLHAALGGQLVKVSPSLPMKFGDSEPPTIVPLDAVIREQLCMALRTCKGRVDGPHGAAAMLKVNPNTLRGKLRKYGVTASDYRS